MRCKSGFSSYNNRVSETPTWQDSSAVTTEYTVAQCKPDNCSTGPTCLACKSSDLTKCQTCVDSINAPTGMPAVDYYLSTDGSCVASSCPAGQKLIAGNTNRECENCMANCK